MQNSLFIEVTITNNCNCNCIYCFEGEKNNLCRNLDIEKRQLELIVDACENFDKTKYNNINITFWGGEPFLNTEFMFEIFKQTYKYDFIMYHCYSNGTLLDKYKELILQDFFNDIKHRFYILLSYDGEPHHTIKRGNNGDKVLETAQFLIDNNILFNFKATLSYDMIDKLPEIWESYKNVTEKFNNIYINYSPTLDTSLNPNKETFEIWKKMLVEIAKKEYKYFLKNNRFILNWFNGSNKKSNCYLENNIHLHNDGNIYICHGCPYLNNSNKFKLNNINLINSLYDIMPNKEFNMQLNEECSKCEAVYCAVCHITLLEDNEDIYEAWSLCRVNNKNKCKYYKYFGYITRLLKLVVLTKIERRNSKNGNSN